jgi:peroxiredoxin family protein
MSTTGLDTSLNELIEAKVAELLDQRVPPLVEQKWQEANKEKETVRKRLAIALVSRGTLDAAYSALILATAAAAMGMECGIYFSFFGLNILKKKAQGRLRLVPVGNPALPLPIPNLLGALPGMTALATAVMNRTIRKKKIVTVPELLQIARDSGVQLWPCQMAMNMFQIKKQDLIDGLPDPVGAATFLAYAAEANVTLFI